MKKILIVLFCTLLLIMALVPVSASASSQGSWLITEWVITESNYDVDGSFYVDSYNDGNFKFYDNMGFSGGYTIVFINSETGERQILEPSSFPTFQLTITEEIEFSPFIRWLNSNGTPVYCDGSSCPVTADDNGTFCADCGRMVRVSMPQPNNWNSDFPWLETINQAYYFIYRVTDGTIYLVEYPTSVRPSYDSTEKNGVLTISEIYAYYRLENDTWVYASDVTPHIVGGYNLGAWTPLFSQVQINDENGNPFFPIPLHKEILEVVKGEVPNLNQRLDGNLTTLILCGVGCLTLLMALPILSRILRNFLPR